MWDMCREVGRGVLIAGLMMQSSPVAWAQLAEVDPALHAAVEALVTTDPDVAGNPELAQLCRTVAESTVTDIRERVAVTQEVAVMQREGVDVKAVIPDAVRETAREKFTQVQGEMREQLEKLRASDPEKAREVELRMREGERCMLAFEAGERYTPSTEMVAHSREMFSDWKEGMIAQGAPPEFVARAEFEFGRWSGGEMAMMMGGPGHEFAGPGPMQGGPGGMPAEGGFAGPGSMGPGHMPTTEQMQAMGMTADQIAAATEAWARGEMPMGGSPYGSGGPTGSADMPTGWARDQSGNFHYVGSEAMPGGGTWEGGSNYGINPSTGGWEPNMGGGMAYGGGMTDWSAGGGTYGGTWEGGSNYGINPATGGWEPGMGGTAYTGGWESTYSGGTTYTGGWESYSPTYSAWEAPTTTTTTYSTELKQDLQSTTTTSAQERYETAIHVHGDKTEHQHTIHVHTDSTRHDHTATSPADVAPNSVFQ